MCCVEALVLRAVVGARGTLSRAREESFGDLALVLGGAGEKDALREEPATRRDEARLGRAPRVVAAFRLTGLGATAVGDGHHGPWRRGRVRLRGGCRRDRRRRAGDHGRRRWRRAPARPSRGRRAAPRGQEHERVQRAACRRHGRPHDSVLRRQPHRAVAVWRVAPCARWRSQRLGGRALALEAWVSKRVKCAWARIVSERAAGCRGIRRAGSDRRGEDRARAQRAPAPVRYWGARGVKARAPRVLQHGV